MAKKPKALPSLKTLQKNAKVIQNAATQNGLADACGFGSTNPFNFPQSQGALCTPEISSVNSLFKNLRWYLVSNDRQLLNEMYVELGLVQTIVDVPVDDAFRGGIEIKSKQLDEDQIAELQVSIDRDDDLNTVAQACKWNRLFGGAGVIILTDQDPSTPLVLESITKDTPLEFRAVDMWELFWDVQNTEGYDPSTQSQDFKFYSYYGVQLHKSRVMRLKGFTAPSFIRPRLRGWGFSVVEVLVRSINQYLKATDLGYEVLDEFKLDVYKIKNLVNTLLSPNGQQQIQQRVQLANWQKNYQNAVVMDSEDDFDHKQLSFAGLAESMAGIRMQVASDLRMPITKLFGQSVSGGIGNSDQNDMENYNSMVESQVRNKIKYDLLRVCEIKCQKLFGFIPDDMSLTFKPLRVLTAEQEENVKTQKFARLMQAKQIGELSSLEFRDAANKGDLFDITLDTSADMLNPDDTEITDIVKEGANNPDKPKDSDDEGADREDTQKSKVFVEPGSGGETNKVPENKEKENKETPNKEPSNKEPKLNQVKPYSTIERLERILKNSAAFDKASYEADGGDAWIDERRAPLFENPGNVDEALWAKAKDASQKAFGTVKWQFVTWWYKKQGGKFH